MNNGTTATVPTFSLETTMSNLNKPTKLSYSSMKTLQSCETKYFHYKVANSPKDSDYEEGDFLGLGKAFHQVLETTLHKSWNESLLMKAMMEHNVDATEKALLSVMLEKYVQYHAKSGIQVVYCELQLGTSNYTGFIDAIAIDPKRKGWWIIDLKTAGRHDENLLPQLAKDMQLNLYAHFADQIDIAVPQVKDLKFLGCRYRQVTKSKAGTQKGLENGVKVYDIEIPVEVMDIENAWIHFLDAHNRADELHKGEAPKKNYGNCISYFQPCQYFSKCHGHLFSEGKKSIRVHTLDTVSALPLTTVSSDEDYL